MAGRLPNFVVVGAAKCGTTSLWHYLAQHPDVFLPRRRKELHHFAADALRAHSAGPGDGRALEDLCASWEEYVHQFVDARDQAAVGDVSPSYFAYPESAEAIRQRLGRPRIVVILREPVQKALSQYSHLVRDGRETLPLWKALQAEPERRAQGYGALWRYAEGGLYAAPMARFLDLFGKDRVQVLFFEELVRDPAATMRSLFGFLGVDPAVPIDTSVVHNRSGAPRSRRLAALLTQQNPLRSLARRLLPPRVTATVAWWLIGLNTGEKPVLDPRSRRFLDERLAPDVERLQQVLGRRPAWLS
jgi:hypothetical protein